VGVTHSDKPPLSVESFLRVEKGGKYSKNKKNPENLSRAMSWSRLNSRGKREGKWLNLHGPRPTAGGERLLLCRQTSQSDESGRLVSPTSQAVPALFKHAYECKRHQMRACRAPVAVCCSVSKHTCTHNHKHTHTHTTHTHKPQGHAKQYQAERHVTDFQPPASSGV